MAGSQVPETITGPRWEARGAAPTGANSRYAPVEGV